MHRDTLESELGDLLLHGLRRPVSAGNVPQWPPMTCFTPSRRIAWAASSGPIVYRSPIGQDRHVGPVDLADQGHVGEDAGVARLVDPEAVGERDHEAGRLAAVADDRLAVDDAAGVDRVRHREADPELLHRPAGVEADDVHALAAEVHGELVLGQHRAPVLGVHGLDVGDVIAVPVGQQHQVDAGRIAQRIGDRRGRQPRIDEHVRAVRSGVTPRAVAVPRDLDAACHREAPPRPFRPEHTSRRDSKAIRSDRGRSTTRARRRVRGTRPRDGALALHGRALPNTRRACVVEDGPVVVARAVVVAAPS